MEKCIYQTRSVVVPILEVLAVPTNHITCVNFEYTAYPLDTLLGESCRQCSCTVAYRLLVSASFTIDRSGLLIL